MINSMVKTPIITTIASGKGGVGKSVVAVNLAYSLAISGMKVLLWDANRNFPNCHLMLGVEPPIRLADVYSGLVEVGKAIFTVNDNLFLLADYPASGETSEADKFSLLEIIKDILIETDFDVIIFDTPAGAGSEVIEASLISDEVWITITDEPTSLLDGYGLIKILLNHIEKSKFKLLVNNIIDFEDGREMSVKLNLATKKFLGFDLEVRGLIPYDRAVRQSILRQELVAIANSNSEVSKEFLRLADELKTKTINYENVG